MKQHRMFAISVVDSDAFLDMPLSSQALYFHLCMRADDDGFLNNSRRIQRTIGGSDDDYKLLIAKRFVIPFDTGVIVIRHWKVHNWIRKDMYKPTICSEEMAKIEDDGTGTYRKKSTKKMLPEPKEEHREEKGDIISKSNLSEPLKEKIADFLAYRNEIKKPFKSERGIKSLIAEAEKQEQKHGSRAVIECINETIRNGWQGIFYDKIKPHEMTKDEAVEFLDAGGTFFE